MMPLSLDLVWACHLWILANLPVACCLSRSLFSPWHFSFNLLFWWWHFLSIQSALVMSEFWQPVSCWQLTSLGPDTLSSPDKLFLSLLSSPPYALRCCFPSMLLSSVPYSLHFPTLFNSSSNLCCLHISTVLTSLLASHLYSLHIPTLFTSTFSSHLFFFTSLLSSTLERRTQTGSVAQTRFPTSTPGATFRDKHRVSCDSYPAHLWKTPPRSADSGEHSSGKPAPAAPVAQRGSRMDAGSHFMRENTWFRSISNLQTSPWRGNSTAICNHWPANHNTTSYFLSLLASHFYSLHTSNLFPSLLASHLYSLPISTLSTYLLSAHLCSLMYCCNDVLLWWCIVVMMYCCDDVLLWWCSVLVMYGCDYVLLWLCMVVMMYYCDYVLCCGDVLLWWCVVVIMYCCDSVLLWWCIAVVMCCCDYALLWLCIVVVMYCCDDVLLWWCIAVVMCCCDNAWLWWCIVVIVLLWWCIVVICCDYVLLLVCIVVVMYCCDDVLLWWCIAVVMCCCDNAWLWWCIVVNYVLLWWCIVLIMYCCDCPQFSVDHIFCITGFRLINFLWWINMCVYIYIIHMNTNIICTYIICTVAGTYWDMLEKISTKASDWHGPA